MGADTRLRFGPDCAVLVAGELRFATPETGLDDFAFDLGRTSPLSSSTCALISNFTVLFRELDGVGSAAESESEITSFDLADFDSDERPPLCPAFGIEPVFPVFLSLLALAPGVCSDCMASLIARLTISLYLGTSSVFLGSPSSFSTSLRTSRGVRELWAVSHRRGSGRKQKRTSEIRSLYLWRRWRKRPGIFVPVQGQWSTCYRPNPSS
ncbi:hypothetical protein EDB86DRAFT_2923757 [Lactarius hatsudake]|nr:hypothetical protein EDB86DRAFT_2923757 [Lactarius hatsudake]